MLLLASVVTPERLQTRILSVDLFRQVSSDGARAAQPSEELGVGMRVLCVLCFCRPFACRVAGNIPAAMPPFWGKGPAKGL